MNEKTNATLKLVLSVSVFALALVAVFGVLDRTSQNYTEASFKRALLTFGIARGLNGVISVAQGTEIAIQPAGFGVNFTPGQILDPINDLVEQFSWVMLASSASLGIQKLLLFISSTLLITVVLVGICSMYLASLWRPDWFAPGMRRVIISGAIIMLFVRFSVPLVAIGSEGMYEYFLKAQFQESSAELEKTQHNISEISSNETQAYGNADQEGLLDMAKRLLNSASMNISINDRIDKYQQLAAEATKHAINLIVVFVVQTILFPLLFLWLLVRGAKATWGQLISL